MKRFGALVADFVGVALTPFIALLIRDNFIFYAPHWEAISGYAVISFIFLSIALVIGGSHRVLWQYTSLPDVLKLTGVVSVALILAVAISFFESRMEGVARSVPVIQWFLLLSGLVGTRIAFRAWHDRARNHRGVGGAFRVQHVLIVGVGPLTELYLESAAAYGSRTVAVVGILSDKSDLKGRLLRQQTILGRVEELPRVIDRLEVHGITLERIAVLEPVEQLSASAKQALLEVERSSNVKVDWIVERLGLSPERNENDPDDREAPLADSGHGLPSVAAESDLMTLGTYGYVKRSFDITLAVALIAILAPLMLSLSLLVLVDVGAPVVFWQQRPGRFGRPFKLFKFCTMRGAHDAAGTRIPDEERVSIVGSFLRRTRLDELPQLYNVVVGEMSFVGPRPLLAADQPANVTSRLSVRPGLTGLAQVHGGRDISAEDKNALDVWYIRNTSLWIDVKILLLTTMVLIRGERVDQDALRAAWQGLSRCNCGAPAKVPSSQEQGKIASGHPAG
jgi:lipopolysaccharide/colanic/teichoic acid biosynthesis glycosyltransferase